MTLRSYCGGSTATLMDRTTHVTSFMDCGCHPHSNWVIPLAKQIIPDRRIYLDITIATPDRLSFQSHCNAIGEWDRSRSKPRHPNPQSK